MAPTKKLVLLAPTLGMINNIRLTKPKVIDARPGLPKLVPVECMPVTIMFWEAMYTQGIKQIAINANTATMPIDCECFILCRLPQQHALGLFAFRPQIYNG